MKLYTAVNYNRDGDRELIGVFSTPELALSALSKERSEPLDFAARPTPTCIGVDRFASDGLRDWCASILICEIDKPLPMYGKIARAERLD